MLANRKLMIFSLALFGLLSSMAQAQTASRPAAPARVAESKDAAAGSEPESSRVEQLMARLEALMQLIERQQAALAAMEKRLAELEGRASQPAAPPAGEKAAAQPANPPSPQPGAAEITASTAAPPAAPPRQEDRAPALVASYDKGRAVLRSPAGDFEMRLSGYAQLDYRGYESGDHPPNTFLIRRARLSVEGFLNRYYGFRVQADFSDRASAILRDAYVSIDRVPEFRVRLGQFKEPFSQEELWGSQYMDFVERSMVNQLAPSRSPGLMAFGDVDDGVFHYAVGAFNGKGLLANNTTNTPEGVGRVRFTPWKNTDQFWLKGLSFGGAYAQGRTNREPSIVGRTESRSFSFYEPVLVNGKLTRANGEMAWLLGPAALRAEYGQVNQAREGLGGDGVDLPGVISKAYLAQFTYLLTGEKKPENAAVVPNRPLFGEMGRPEGWGAWELKARIASLHIDDGTARSNRARSFYFGTNWYLNRFVRHMLDFGFERFDDPNRSPRPGDRNYFVVLSRVQVIF